MNTIETRLTKSALANFTGDDVRYQSMNRSVIYSPGVKFVAEHGNAYWLVDAIVSYFGSPIMRKAMKDDYRLESLQFWRLEVLNESASLTARSDDGVKPFVHQAIEFTDFPLASVDIWAGYDGQRWTLYLPSEH